MPRFVHQLIPLPAFVVPIPGEPLRFRVLSRGRANIQHTVDLQEYGFNGECSCENFQFTQIKKLREDKRDGVVKPRRCFHIQRAYEFYGAVKARLEAFEFYKRHRTEADNDYRDERRSEPNRRPTRVPAGSRPRPSADAAVAGKRGGRDYQLDGGRRGYSNQRS